MAESFPQYGHHFAVAVVAIPDQARGERIIAVTNERSLTLTQIREAIQGHGLSNLAVPKEIRLVSELPRLGSGKVNHRALEQESQVGGT